MPSCCVQPTTGELAPVAAPSSAFHEHEGAHHVEERCFSIVTADRTLDLEAHDKAERDAWVLALQVLLQRSGRSFNYQARYNVQEELEGVGQGECVGPRCFPHALADSVLLCCSSDVEFAGELVGRQVPTPRKVVLAVGIRDLPRMDWLSDTDPIVALFVTGRCALSAAAFMRWRCS